MMFLLQEMVENLTAYSLCVCLGNFDLTIDMIRCVAKGDISIQDVLDAIELSAKKIF